MGAGAIVPGVPVAVNGRATGHLALDARSRGSSVYEAMGTARDDGSTEKVGLTSAGLPADQCNYLPSSLR